MYWIAEGVVLFWDDLEECLSLRQRAEHVVFILNQRSEKLTTHFLPEIEDLRFEDLTQACLVSQLTPLAE